MNTQKDIPAIIKAARIRAGLTQKELGEKIGYSGESQERAIRNIENGSRGVPIEKARALITALDLTFDDIIP